MLTKQMYTALHYAESQESLDIVVIVGILPA